MADACRRCCEFLRPSFASRARVFEGTCAHAYWRATAIRALMVDAFPENADALAESDDVIDNLLGFHIAEHTRWLFCYTNGQDASARGARSADGGRLVGVAMLVTYHDSLFVANIAVDSSVRGRGLGSLLMRSASALAADLGLPRVAGSVPSDAAHLERLYARLGGTAHPPEPCSDGAVVRAPTRRWDAPSGKPTARDTPAPQMLPTPPPTLTEIAAESRLQYGRVWQNGASEATEGEAAAADGAGAAAANGHAANGSANKTD